MKTVIKFFLLVIIAGSFSGFIAHLERPLSVNLEASDNKVGVDFLIHATDKRIIIVRIRNRDRDIVFEQTFHGSVVYTGSFNLNNLKDGKYYFEVRHSKQKFSKQISLKKSSKRTLSLK